LTIRLQLFHVLSSDDLLCICPNVFKSCSNKNRKAQAEGPESTWIKCPSWRKFLHISLGARGSVNTHKLFSTLLTRLEESESSTLFAAILAPLMLKVTAAYDIC